MFWFASYISIYIVCDRKIKIEKKNIKFGPKHTMWFIFFITQFQIGKNFADFSAVTFPQFLLRCYG
jgi:hypothetical protein